MIGADRFGAGPMSAELTNLFALAIGFAVAGLLCSGYQLVTRRPASFRLLQRGPRPSTLAAVPLIVFAAPFIIVRNILRASRIEGRPFTAVAAAVVVAGLWSLMSGTVVVMALSALSAHAG
jgi:hypothetical protein